MLDILHPIPNDSNPIWNWIRIIPITIHSVRVGVSGWEWRNIGTTYTVSPVVGSVVFIYEC